MGIIILYLTDIIRTTNTKRTRIKHHTLVREVQYYIYLNNKHVYRASLDFLFTYL